VVSGYADLIDSIMELHLIETRGDADEIMRGLAAPQNRDALMAWLLEVNGLEALVRALVVAVDDRTDIVAEVEHAALQAEEADRG
jgi:hypothetical protein